MQALAVRAQGLESASIAFTLTTESPGANEPLVERFVWQKLGSMWRTDQLIEDPKKPGLMEVRVSFDGALYYLCSVDAAPSAVIYPSDTQRLPAAFIKDELDYLLHSLPHRLLARCEIAEVLPSEEVVGESCLVLAGTLKSKTFEMHVRFWLSPSMGLAPRRAVVEGLNPNTGIGYLRTWEADGFQKFPGDLWLPSRVVGTRHEVRPEGKQLSHTVTFSASAMMVNGDIPASRFGRGVIEEGASVHDTRTGIVTNPN